MSKIEIPITVPDGGDLPFNLSDLESLLDSFPTFSITVNAQSTLVALESHSGLPTIISPRAVEYDLFDWPPIYETIIIPTPPTRDAPTITPEPHLLPILVVIFFVFLYLHLKEKMSLNDKSH